MRKKKAQIAPEVPEFIEVPDHAVVASLPEPSTVPADTVLVCHGEVWFLDGGQWAKSSDAS
jgi:hypothetical protein